MSLSPLPLRILVVTTLVAVASPVLAEGLLWKANSRYQPQIVPPYTGQPSPFPMARVISETVAQGPTLEELETERMQQDAIEQATAMIASPHALTPYMAGTVVGGLVEGANGRKILVGNDWIGIGMTMQVRLMASDEVNAAIRRVSEFNEDMAKSLREQLAQRLRQSPATQMKLKEIRKDSLVLSSEYGQKVMQIIAR